jgi:hypothetical protein
MPSLDAHMLIADIASGDSERRRQATEVISEIDHDTDVDVSVFVSSLRSVQEDVVVWSTIALEHLGERGRAAIPGLLALLQREQLFPRQSAVKTLAAVGPREVEARAAVFLSFADSGPFVRREALQACIGLPSLSGEELASIAAMATDSDESVARWSEITLRNIRLNEGASSGHAE